MLIDFHVHYFPKPIFKAIWKYFETHTNGLWKINYKFSRQEISNALNENGVKRFTTLVYAHKAGIAMDLNRYICEESGKNSSMIPFGTIYAGDGNVEETAKKIFEDWKFSGIKLHPFVSKENLDDERFFPVYEMMEDKGKVLVCHPGSGPVYTQFDGANRLRTVLERFPRLKTVIAHCGAFEYGDYNKICDDFENVYFDTAMNCVHTIVFEHNCPGKEFFIKYQDRILFGSDFPNIPYDYVEQSKGINKFQLGSEIENKIKFLNAAKLLGIEKDFLS
ncbi:MAG: amidohydrolase family protein [Leptospiraceae bacterium]|nr:amidohydrolase family protein [Leptospiraceae bacterium]MCK6380220.1 amidohydrolase family protein [Leptospiraceae bacterium]NUM41328.1 amidohydrolase family protein [Leptospiraceae bacterium]